MSHSRAFAAVVSCALVGATLSPLLRDPRDDGFPLSTYPMFAFARPTKLTMSYALGVTRAGERRYLTPEIVGSGEVLQARAIIQHGVSRGGTELMALCRRIADAVQSFDEYSDVVTIRIVTGTHEAVELLVRDQLGTELERTKCAVRR